MNVKEWIKKNGLQMEVHDLKRHQVVDIGFINSDGNEDETEFNVSSIGTKAGVNELSQLFAHFCKENKFKTNTVISVIVVKSTDSFKELENL